MGGPKGSDDDKLRVTRKAKAREAEGCWTAQVFDQERKVDMVDAACNPLLEAGRGSILSAQKRNKHNIHSPLARRLDPPPLSLTRRVPCRFPPSISLSL